jgi:Zn-dependent protease with chaperone function
MTTVHARYFNGVDATAFPVTLTLADGSVVVSGAGVERREPLARVEISEAIGSTPRLVRFGDGAFVEVTDAKALEALLAAHGIHSSALSQWEGSPRWIAAGGFVFVAALVAAYLYGIPLAAHVVADRIPDAATRRLSTEVLAVLDGQIFNPSALPLERQQGLDAAFRRLEMPGGAGSSYQLVFRRSDVVGANAMALPSGTIVVTDDLVALAEDDRELLGVLAHEAGHVDHRHGLRNMLQNSMVGLVVAWFIGDISSIAAAAPTALLEASYSRSLEREADVYAVQVLRTNGIAVRHLADLLRRLDEASGASGVGSALKYLSTHPATSERIAQLEAE